MIFVDVRSPKPLYEQIKDSIRNQMIRGLLQPDDKLPSVRELARQAAINPNTIQKAYRDLEAEGLIYTAPGRGCFVAQPKAEYAQRRKEELWRQMEPLVAELRYLGVDAQEICEQVKGGMPGDD